MPLRPEQIAQAALVQETAAHDDAAHVRVVAGPGTGKSATIEARVCWLLEQGVEPASIVAISFTRAAADDLGKRIVTACERAGVADGEPVAVSTLHSLALRALRQSGVLSAYPADPVVLQRWELREIFEAEFGNVCGVGSITRREQIRRDHEAFWCTGGFDPESLVPPDPPISEGERQSFRAFHQPTTQLYSCVLPGEVVAKCVDMMDAGTLDPVELLGVSELIVDEFQDLNPMDLRFVHGLAERGVRIFAAGDDDQSLYAFRFATPEGIEQFAAQRPGTADHSLFDCFRCAPRVLDAAQSLIRRFPAPGRIDKNLTSLWAEADPPVEGAVRCWSFASGQGEARAIATSCRRLIDTGVQPSEIMILLTSTRSQSTAIHEALSSAEVPFSPAREEALIDNDAGRAGYALLSVVVDPQNYIAHRTLLGIKRGVGLRTCTDIRHSVITNNRNYRDLFYETVPDGLVSNRARTAIAAAADVCAHITSWNAEDPLADHLDDLCRLVDELRGQEGSSGELRALLDDLPVAITLREAHGYLSADRDEDRRRVLEAVAERLRRPEIAAELVPERVQVMTMHGAKGLSAQVVFIPGLEDTILPGEQRRLYPGLVLEAARMLYVSITRARYMCVLTYARTRIVFGSLTQPPPSRFASALSTQFHRRDDGLSSDQAAGAAAGIEQMSG